MKGLIIWLLVGISTFNISCTKTSFIEPSLLFTDNMVLQQNSNVTIWGIADSGAKLTIKGSWGSQTSCTANKSGKWLAKLATTEAGGPYELSISSGKINRAFSNLMLGEVWVCSGQSNMEMPLAGNWAQVNNAEQEAAAADYPNIRLFTVQKNIAFNPIDTLAARGWQVCNPNTVKNFSATAYFFGRTLHKKLNVPIGLIHSSWGGTVAEAWTSKQSLMQLDDFSKQAEKISTLDASRDSLEKKFEADTKQMMQEITLADPGLEGTTALFAATDLDDSDWMPFDFPKLWEETGLGNYDGSGWFRKTITLTAALAESELTLYYGAPDDYDEAWFNGVKVGENKEWGKQRVYKIPKGVAKPGKNVITLRVYDYTGGGGFMGEPKDYQLVFDKGASIPLAKGWKAKKGFDFADIATRPVSLFDRNQPTVLYNAMIHPLIPFTIQGAIWYQGESNAGRAYQYRKLFKTMIKDWRRNWNQGDFPFYFVQLAGFMTRNENPTDDTWAELREAQTLALELPNTGMAVAIDIGDAKDIHPGNKQDIGKRLALNALAKTYGLEIPYSGPMYQSYEIRGNSIELYFDFVYDGMSASDGRSLNGFAIAGADKKFYWADARINENKIMVSSNKVPEPVAVRYAWSANPDCNLINSAGLPASPFRTDDWKGITEP